MIRKLFVIALVTFTLGSTANAIPNPPATQAVVSGGDPWIYQAYKELYNRQPTTWELNIHNYNNGSWNNYNELKQYIKDYQAAISQAQLQISLATLKGDKDKTLALINTSDGKKAVDIISTADGNVIAAGGGNVIAAGGGNAIAVSGGGVITVTSGMAGVTFGNSYTVQSAGTKVVRTSGKGALIIR